MQIRCGSYFSLSYVGSGSGQGWVNMGGEGRGGEGRGGEGRSGWVETHDIGHIISHAESILCYYANNLLSSNL